MLTGDIKKHLQAVRTVDLEEACEAVGGEVVVEAGLDGEVEQEALIPLSRRPCMLIHLGGVKP
jgi:hypothetical protein